MADKQPEMTALQALRDMWEGGELPPEVGDLLDQIEGDQTLLMVGVISAITMLGSTAMTVDADMTQAIREKGQGLTIQEDDDSTDLVFRVDS